jgi:hypothetical protein
MKVGDVVRVYQKPLTREDFEGEAKIRRILSHRREGDGILYRAVVNFPEDGPSQVVERTIAEGDVIPGWVRS